MPPDGKNNFPSRTAAIEGGLLVDVSDAARALGMEMSVALALPLAHELEPSNFLARYGLAFDDRVENLLKVLHLYVNDVANPDRVIFPITLTKGPLIREELIEVLALVERDEQGRRTVTLMKPKGE
jgi:hypothetical protein